jgi:hypothetical protein
MMAYGTQLYNTSSVYNAYLLAYSFHRKLQPRVITVIASQETNYDYITVLNQHSYQGTLKYVSS